MARPTRGAARVFGLAADAPQASVEIRRRTGFVSDDKDLYDYMTVGEMIRFTAAFYPRWRRDLSSATCARSSCRPTASVKALSRGMRTKLALLLALCRGAELLILDEPTSGLDPAMTEEVLQALVAHVAAKGRPCSSRRIRSPRSIRSPTAWRSSIAAASSVAGALDDLRENYRRIQLVFDGDAPDAAFRRRASSACGARARADGACRAPAPSGVLDEARALKPVVGRRAPRHVERNLPRNRRRGGLTCSGTSRGSKPAGAS